MTQPTSPLPAFYIQTWRWWPSGSTCRTATSPSRRATRPARRRRRRRLSSSCRWGVHFVWAAIVVQIRQGAARRRRRRRLSRSCRRGVHFVWAASMALSLRMVPHPMAPLLQLPILTPHRSLCRSWTSTSLCQRFMRCAHDATLNPLSGTPPSTLQPPPLCRSWTST